MNKSKVFFSTVNNSNPKHVAKIARKLLEKVVDSNKIVLEKEIPLKVHTGQPGNISFIKPENFTGVVDYLLGRDIRPYFVETGRVTGPCSKGSTHRIIAKKHGFTKVPFVVGDGEDGKDHIQVKINNGKHFKSCMIAKELIKPSQIIVISHFKGHIEAGFGAAIKMLGVGFASRQGKIEIHSKVYTHKQKTINWMQEEKQYHERDFLERMAEYALAAVKGKNNIYITFALSIVENCDCDGEEMTPIYDDLGIFASTDPVAIDKACLDLLAEREGKKTFGGEEVFAYAEKIGLGSTNYQLIKLTSLHTRS